MSDVIFYIYIYIYIYIHNSDLFSAHLFWGLNSKVTFAIIKVWRSHGWSVWVVCKIFMTQYLLKSLNPRIVLPCRRLCMSVFLGAIVTCFLMLPFSLYRFISKPNPWRFDSFNLYVPAGWRQKWWRKGCSRIEVQNIANALHLVTALTKCKIFFQYCFFQRSKVVYLF